MIRTSFLASLGAKAAIGGTVLVLASAGSAAAWKASGNMAAAHNHTGQGASQIVQNCKSQVRGNGGHPDPDMTHKSQGIGKCVSAQVQQMGKQNSTTNGASNAASSSATAGKHLGQTGMQPSQNGSVGNGQGNSNGQGNNSNQQGNNGNAQGSSTNAQGNNGNAQGGGQPVPAAAAGGAAHAANGGGGSQGHGGP